MNRPLLPLVAFIAAHALSGCASAPRAPALPRSITSDRDTIRPFTSQAELAQFLGALAAESRREYERAHAHDPPPRPIVEPPPPPESAGVPLQVGTPAPGGSGSIEASPAPSYPPTTSAQARSVPLQTQVRTSTLGGTAAPAPAVGVDEGGIVKAVGGYLVVLHRGRLFSVRVGGGALEPVSAVDAFGPGVDTENYMYDRLLVSGDRVLVLGTMTFSGRGNQIQVGVFHLAPDGRRTGTPSSCARSMPTGATSTGRGPTRSAWSAAGSSSTCRCRWMSGIRWGPSPWCAVREWFPPLRPTCACTVPRGAWSRGACTCTR